MPKSIRDIEKIWANVEGVRKLSDRAIGVGPFGLGLDGLLTWIPWVGDAYTIGAGSWLIFQAIRAKAGPTTLAKMGGYLLADGATGLVPFLGAAVDTVFAGHAFAAKALQKDIESTHWVEEHEDEARTAGRHDAHLEAAKTAGKRRVIYLGKGE